MFTAATKAPLAGGAHMAPVVPLPPPAIAAMFAH